MTPIQELWWKQAQSDYQVWLIRRSGEVCPDLWKWPRTQ